MLGARDVERAIPLRYVNAEFWETTLVFPKNDSPSAAYNYVLKQPDGSVIFDWGADRLIPPPGQAEEILVVDSWNPAGLFENAFYTEPFKEVLLKRSEQESHSEPLQLNFDSRATNPYRSARGHF